MLFSKQLNYYTAIEKVLQVLQYFAKVVILRRARSFCGALFKRIFAWKRGISKRQFIEIVSLLVVLHLSYSKYEGVKVCFYSCRYQNQTVSLVSHSSRSCSIRVAIVSFLQHSCRTCVALVSHLCCQCRIRVARVWHSCCKLDQIEQNRARVFSNNELFIFHCNNSTNFESVFCIKTVKSRLFKKYLKRRKSQARFCLSLSWLNISEKKLLTTTILPVQELIKQEKQLVFGPTLNLIFLIFGKCEKSKLHILKKVGLSTFEEIL